MLEKMNEFFNKRLDGYDEHMMTTIESSDVFYPFTADCLPKGDSAKHLIWVAVQVCNWSIISDLIHLQK